MLNVHDLTAVRRSDQHTLFSHLSFSLQKGDKLAVIGAEGNGKSSLLEILCRPGRAAHYLTWTGSAGYSPWKLAYLAQECPDDFLRSEAESLILPYIEDTELYRLAAAFGLSCDLLFAPRAMETFSGGERMKFRILLMMLSRPDLYIIDEPTNDLDLQSIGVIENFIRDTKEAVLYVSHDETLLERTANRILHIEQIWRRTEARVTLSGLGFRAYMESFRSGIERQNQLASKEEKDHRAKMERYRRIESRVEHEQATISRGDPHGGRLLKKKMHAVKSTGRRFEREHEKQTARTNREDDVDFFLSDLPGIPAGKDVLNLYIPELSAGSGTLSRNIRLSVQGPEHLCVTGPNGCGKSTLLRAIRSALEEKRDLRVFYLPQNWNELFSDEDPALGFLAPDRKASSLQEASDLLGSLCFARDEMTRPIGTLSGGQKVKLAFARLRLARPNVLLLDEPSRHLSPLTNPAFREGIADFQGCVISVSHDRAFLREVCARVLRLTPEGLTDEDPALFC